MRKYKDFMSGSRIVTIIIFICLTLLGVSAWSSGTEPHRKPGISNRQKSGMNVTNIQAMAESLQADKLPVRNMAQSFRLIAIEKIENRDLRITLQNDYSKRINGFWLFVGNVGTEIGPLYEKEQMISSGGIYTIDLPIQADTDTRGIGIVAVTFEDGSGDGDSESLYVIRETRKGEKIQIKKILKLIRQHLMSPDMDTSTALDRLESQIKSLSVDSGNGQRDPLWSGLNSAKQRAISFVQSVRSKQYQSIQSANKSPQKRNDFSIQTELAKTIEYYEKILATP
jgi:hypothetical protein